MTTGTGSKKKGRTKRKRSISPERTSYREDSNRIILGRQRTVGPITYLSTSNLLTMVSTGLPSGLSIVEPSWALGAPKGILKTYTDDDVDDVHDSKRRRTLINLRSGDLDRKPTFYSEAFVTGGGTNTGKPQGPHTVAHAFNEEMIEQLKTRNASDEPNGIRTVFSTLLRSSTEVEDFVKKIMPAYETDLGASGVRAAAELYQREYGRMINKLNKVTSADTDAISALYTEISSLLNLDPASTYGWDRTIPFPKKSKELAGKGEAAGIRWLRDAKNTYESTMDDDEKKRQKLQMARALTRLLDLPAGLSDDFKSAAEDLQNKRLKQFFNDDGLVNEIKALFKNQKFKDWVAADEQMWENQKSSSAELPTAKAAIDSQDKYHALQSSLGYTVGGTITLPSAFTTPNKTRDGRLKTRLGDTDFEKLKKSGYTAAPLTTTST